MEKVKNLSLRKMIAVMVMGMFIAGTSIAGVVDNKDNDKVNKTTLKARQTVEQASPEDWLALAQSAEMCFKKNVNLKEAAEWIDRSIAIKETSFNLEVKGDYYLVSNLPDKALEYYVLSLQKGQGEGASFDSEKIQGKIVNITSK